MMSVEVTCKSTPLTASQALVEMCKAEDANQLVVDQTQKMNKLKLPISSTIKKSILKNTLFYTVHVIQSYIVCFCFVYVFITSA